MNRICFLLALTLASSGAMAQTLSSVESVEYEPNSNRWFVNAGSSILVTADEGISWETFGNGGAWRKHRLNPPKRCAKRARI